MALPSPRITEGPHNFGGWITAILTYNSVLFNSFSFPLSKSFFPSVGNLKITKFLLAASTLELTLRSPALHIRGICSLHTLVWDSCGFQEHDLEYVKYH